MIIAMNICLLHRTRTKKQWLATMEATKEIPTTISGVNVQFCEDNVLANTSIIFPFILHSCINSFNNGCIYTKCLLVCYDFSLVQNIFIIVFTLM